MKPIWKELQFDNSVTLLGKDTEKIGEVKLIQFDNIVGGLSAGGSPIDHPLGRVNEDGIGIKIDHGISLIIVCDSHFGGIIADRLIQGIINDDSRQYQNLIENPQLYQFSKYIKTSVERILQKLATKSYNNAIGETTLIIAMLHDNQLYWVNIGDSRIYRIKDNSIEILNQLEMIFVSPLFDFGNIKFNQSNMENSIILIATDGLPECKYGELTLSKDQIAGLMTTNPLKSVKNLFVKAFEHGGEDNIAIVLYDNR